MIRALTQFASPAGARGRLLTFYFHRVLAKPDPLLPGEADAQWFDAALSWIGAQFRVLPPAEACRRLAQGTLPARAAAITFDDGYRDNFDVAWPILRRHGMPAAVFVATGFLGEGLAFNDRILEALRTHSAETIDVHWLGLGMLDTSSIASKLLAVSRIVERVKYEAPDRREDAVARIEAECGHDAAGYLRRHRQMMTAEEVRALHDGGIEIGGHTRHHPILRALPASDAESEIVRGRDDLAAITGRPPTLFAYPNGKLGVDFDPDHVEMVKRSGFEFAFTTHLGPATARSDRFRLPRFMPWSRNRTKFALRALEAVLGDPGLAGMEPVQRVAVR